MILTKQFLNERVSKLTKEKGKNAAEKQQELNEYDVFISYSRNDQEFALKVVKLLNTYGYKTYIDCIDSQLKKQKTINEDIAKRLVERMKKCKALLYLYSPSSSVSKWCQWEVGVFSGIKNFRCANLPIVDKKGEKYKNQEYLELYPHVEFGNNTNTNEDEFFVYEDDKTCITLKRWMNGAKFSKQRKDCKNGK